MLIKPMLDDAGITVAEFAKMCGVTRGMVYRWERGSNVHPLRVPRVKKLLAAIAAAIEAGELPLGKDKDARAQRVRDLVVANLKKVA